MPKIKHIALSTQDVDKTAKFYIEVFGMKEIAKIDSPGARGYYLSDGDLNLAILKFRTAEAADRGDGMGTVMGLHHFGFWVEDSDEVRRRLLENEAHLLRDRPHDSPTSFFEEKWVAPDGVQFDIAQAGWAGAQPPDASLAPKDGERQAGAH